MILFSLRQDIRVLAATDDYFGDCPLGCLLWVISGLAIRIFMRFYCAADCETTVMGSGLL
jgi:hypothetical protein